jgi:hypothetical protein
MFVKKKDGGYEISLSIAKWAWLGVSSFGWEEAASSLIQVTCFICRGLARLVDPYPKHASVDFPNDNKSHRHIYPLAQRIVNVDKKDVGAPTILQGH